MLWKKLKQSRGKGRAMWGKGIVILNRMVFEKRLERGKGARYDGIWDK